MEGENKVKVGLRLTVCRVCSCSCKASCLRKISAKTKRLLSLKPKRLSRKLTRSNAEIANMVVSFHAGLHSRQKKPTRTNSRLLKMKRISSEKNLFVIIPSSHMKLINSGLDSECLKSLELVTLEKLRLFTTTFQLKPF